MEVKLTKDTVTVYYKKNQICQHKRLYGHRNQYSTNEAHMPKNHQLFQWNKERFMNWAATIGPSTVELINLMFSRYKVEEQAYKGCLSILKLSDKYSQARLENACKLALSRLSNPTYKNIKLILESGQDEAKQEPENTINKEDTTYAFTRGTEYYGGKKVMNQEVYEKLREMRLPIMAEEYKDQSENTDTQNMTFEERLEAMVIKEYDSQINHTVKRYIKNANFHDSNANLQDINYKPDREINRGLIEELSTNEYIQQKLNIIFDLVHLGQERLGFQTLLELMPVWKDTKFNIFVCQTCFRKLKKQRFKGITKKIYEETFKVDLLILDEFLLTNISEGERNDLFEVIQSRTDNKSTIYCSQWAPEGWLGKLGNGPLADAILDRIRNSSYTILF